MTGRVHAPPGWPKGVLPPGLPDWEATAANWLLDHCPPEYRGYAVMRRHVVVLARFAALHVDASRDAVRRGVSEARAALRGVIATEVIESAILAWQREDARLQALRREVRLVEEALHGRRFVRRI